MIETGRLLLRPLTVDDATERYLSWFSGEGAERIQSSSSMTAIASLKAYIAERIGLPTVLFLGIFQKDDGLHVGNIKFEPVDEVERVAVCGIFVGDPGARGKGYAREAIVGSGNWLRANRNIERIVLGVEADNIAARRAYENVGFKPERHRLIPDKPDVVSMVWDMR